MLLQGKEIEVLDSKAIQNDFMVYLPFLFYIQSTLSSSFLYTLIPSKHERNLFAHPTSQSLRGLEKDGLQPLSPRIEEFHTSSTHAFFELAKENNDRKELHNRPFPHHLSFQNLTLCPLSTV